MTCAVGQGFFMGLCLKLLNGGKKAGVKKTDSGKKRTKRA
jgi:hypothetical protein